MKYCVTDSNKHSAFYTFDLLRLFYKRVAVHITCSCRTRFNAGPKRVRVGCQVSGSAKVLMEIKTNTIRPGRGL